MLQMLFADSEGEYLPFGNDDRPSNDRYISAAQWCRRAWRECSQSTNK